MIFFIFPIHLYNIPTPLQYDKIYIIEHPRFFTDFKYHKLKLAFHRATMKSYFDSLKKTHKKIKYIELANYSNFSKKHHNSIITSYDLNDNICTNQLTKDFKNIKFINNLNFILTPEDIISNSNIFYKKPKFNFMNFYKWQRTRLNILINSDGTPKGGKWSFDKENRKKIPHIFPDSYSINLCSYKKEAIEYVNRNFQNNYGSLDNFIYPIDFNSAKEFFKSFVKNKLNNFGPYEDAVQSNSAFLYHSVLTPLLNIGILTDNYIISYLQKYISKNKGIASIESLEGFVRQVIGWRNYIFAIYIICGPELKNMNYFNNNKSINKDLIWSAKTNIKPIDDSMQKIIKYSYVHHIERLMYLGNFLLLLQTKPIDVYTLFMEWTIDAYEWVMVPNIFGMSQFADGGTMMTRPYLSSSNYICKLSDYKKSEEWTNVFDSLYYYFIYKKQNYFKNNYVMAAQIKHWTNKSKDEQNKIINTAKKYIKYITVGS